MFLEYRFSVNIGDRSTYSYVRTIDIAVKEYEYDYETETDEETAQDEIMFEPTRHELKGNGEPAHGVGSDQETVHTVGRLKIEKIMWRDAQQDGASLYDDCDEEGLDEVHRILTCEDDPNELRDDLAFEGPLDEVLFVRGVLLHPDIKDRIAVLDAALKAITTVYALVVMWKNERHNTHFKDKELADLKFAKIAGEDLIYRDMSSSCNFEEEYPRGRHVELAATAAHERWVEEHWKWYDF